jgi:hypothetical protein
MIYLASWLVPGLGHLWLGRRFKGLVFMVALPAMFVIGLVLKARLFPFVWSEPLVALSAIANVAGGAPYFVAKMFELGAGQPAAWTYDYGNAFVITSGLLNMLVGIDAHDIALGRK